ncbi:MULTISPECIES: hypothetical protein [unclassified Chelatococcus]|uniref:hypothetical protein n=1 Tax=unclassified Chelatococcus TaxID=2638111 RepID=UPI001BCEED71|nr:MULTISPECIES: hypothetical protein [unclassified Chelatococcus]MBS7701490.1 hypothetical protein [Chelatococcus sp. YT9]MBX3559220.1 hypothetical protein [Chelatococcus sp.]
MLMAFGIFVVFRVWYRQKSIHPARGEPGRTKWLVITIAMIPPIIIASQFVGALVVSAMIGLWPPFGYIEFWESIVKGSVLANIWAVILLPIYALVCNLRSQRGGSRKPAPPRAIPESAVIPTKSSVRSQDKIARPSYVTPQPTAASEPLYDIFSDADDHPASNQSPPDVKREIPQSFANSQISVRNSKETFDLQLSMVLAFICAVFIILALYRWYYAGAF